MGNKVLQLFHHIHHNEGGHEIHHCGGYHRKIDPAVNYTIKHCSCGKHSIDKEIAIGHAVDGKLEPVAVKIKFFEKCPGDRKGQNWHLESGKIFNGRVE